MTLLPGPPGTRLDSLGLFGLTAAVPEQVAAAQAAAEERLVDLEPLDVSNVVVAGVGAGGSASDVVAAVTAPLSPVPVAVVRSYECPAYVGPETLVLAVSASGDSEETIQVATDAEAAGAAVIAVTRGGQLARLAERWGSVTIPVEVGAGAGVPRAAVAALAVASLAVLDHLDLYPGGQAWIGAAARQLAARRDEIEAAGESSGPALVARRIGRTIGLVHGGGPVGAAAARRWKTQINENAKTPAFWADQPDLSHNEVCGWGQHGDVTRQMVTAVSLRHEGEHPQVDRRFELVAEMLREVVADVIEVEAAGEGDLAQLLDLMLFGDYVSLWMAAAAGVDPGPTPALADLGRALSGE